MKNRLFIRIGPIAIALAAVGCKPLPKNSETKSLENFAAQTSLKQNSCKGSPEDLGSASVASLAATVEGDTDAALIKAVRESASAVPDPIRDLFVNLGGVIQLTADAGNQCSRESTARLRNYGYEIQSCFHYVEATATSPRDFRIVLKNDAAVIRHELVRQFGYIFAQRFSKMSFSVANGSLVASQARSDRPGMMARKVAVANAFFADVAQSPFFKIEALNFLLGDDGAAIIKRHVREKSVDVLAGLALSPAAVNQLRDFVFAEAFDSFYCNAYANPEMERLTRLEGSRIDLTALREVLKTVENTRVIMGFLFPSSLHVFNRIHPELYGQMVGKPKGLGLTYDGGCEVSVADPAAGVVPAGMVAGENAVQLYGDVPAVAPVAVATSGLGDSLPWGPASVVGADLAPPQESSVFMNSDSLNESAQSAPTALAMMDSVNTIGASSMEPWPEPPHYQNYAEAPPESGASSAVNSALAYTPPVDEGTTMSLAGPATYLKKCLGVPGAPKVPDAPTVRGIPDAPNARGIAGGAPHDTPGVPGLNGPTLGRFPTFAGPAEAVTAAPIRNAGDLAPSAPSAPPQRSRRGVTSTAPDQPVDLAPSGVGVGRMDVPAKANYFADGTLPTAAQVEDGTTFLGGKIGEGSAAFHSQVLGLKPGETPDFGALTKEIPPGFAKYSPEGKLLNSETFEPYWGGVKEGYDHAATAAVSRSQTIYQKLAKGEKPEGIYAYENFGATPQEAVTALRKYQAAYSILDRKVASPKGNPTARARAALFGVHADWIEKSAGR